MSERTAMPVPRDQAAEQSILGALLIDSRAFDRVADVLQASHFFDSRHRDIFAVITQLTAAGKPADAVTVHAALSPLAASRTRSGGEAIDLPYLEALAISVPSAANVRRYAEIVRDRASRRALITTADESLSLALEGGEVAPTLDRITSMFGELERQQVRKAPRSIAEIAVERIDHYTALSEGTATAGWPTHIPALDARLNGGLRAGSLNILAARPAVGKSSLGEWMGLAFAADGHPTLFLSLEMGDTEVADRGVANTGRVSYGALLTGKMLDNDWSRASEAMERLGRLPFFVDDQPALTLYDIRVKAKSIKGLRVLILDYLQLCSGSRRDAGRNGEIEEISRGLKALAKELGIAVIALSQLNRDVEKRAVKRPTLSDLRDSGAIEQDADVVMFLWPVREFADRRIIGLSIDKNRQGRLGEVGLDFYGDTQRWEQSTADIRQVARSSGGDL